MYGHPPPGGKTRQQEKQAAEMEQAQLQQAQQVAESAGKIAPALKAMGGMNE